jgi:hypothetical protein
MAIIDFATGECTSAQYEAVESSCDGLDNDCDGIADENCGCPHPGGSQGVCASATVDPTSGLCQADLYQLDEIMCDNEDNDCDGITDEGCGCPHPSGLVDGVCASSTIDPASGSCVAQGFEANESLCDNVDNDCDGTIDEGCTCTHPRGSDGVCAGAVFDAQGACEAPNFESIETSCTGGLDNDCDGDVDCDDTDCAGDPACTELVCDNNIDDDGDGPIDCLDSDCQNKPVCTLEDCSNNIDDNANGVINEGCSCIPAPGPQGVCALATVNPSNGACEAPDFEPNETLCDGKDNDCDGVEDENCGCIHPRGAQGVCGMATVNPSNGVCEAPDFQPTETLCDGLDNDCDGVADEGCGCPHPGGTQGVCAMATVSQANGACVAPNYQSDESACDGADNDCDGIADENCTCPHPGGTQGVCALASVNPSNGVCETADFEPTETLCDNKDNDCDGTIDEGCPCAHPNGTAGVCGGALIDPSGQCKAPNFESPETTCDNEDNDCDGIADENCACPHPGGTQGVCATASISPADGMCVASAYQAVESTCDGLDNDCDGVADEGCGCPHPGGTQGVCGAATRSPVDGTCEAPDYQPTETLCDGLDNDCDGVADEDCGCNHPSGSMLGVCGLSTVNASTGACEAPGYESVETVCDNEDNDCDGIHDEGCACPHPQGSQGVCGMASISDATGACEAPNFESDEFSCDSADNDCDGIEDENCGCPHPSGSSLGVCGMAHVNSTTGACEASGYEANERTCDNEDNDCDGIIDEGCPCAHPSGSSVGVCAFAKIDAASGMCEAPGYEANEATCNDGEDNNCDGLTDCDDLSCAASPLCQDPCTVNVDIDGDGQIACGDLECRSNAPNCNLESCPTSGPGTQDFNQNGLVGNSDPDCFTWDYNWTIHRAQEVCDDGIDNDHDTFIDCVDVNCADHPSCTGLEDCDDFIDNNGDGKIDCEDDSCTFDYKCYRGGEIYCGANGDVSDDDNDGPLNCADNDCGRDPYCHSERCFDARDNDGDGLVDFHDPDCAWDKNRDGGYICF